MGFTGGNILEPSMGVGNFFGMLPNEMSGSKLYGVELDSVSGRISKQLYPKADITIGGFETTDRSDFFDVAIGNVPFGQYQVNDPAYNKLGFNIHNYFFAKALDQVRPGGVVAFVTSRYTLDSKDTAVRKYLAQRAEFLGAIRLPNNAFKANAGSRAQIATILMRYLCSGDKETIDLAALEEYGREYAASLGFTIDTTMTLDNSSYYPGDRVRIRSLEDGRRLVAENVQATADNLIGYGDAIEGFRCNILIEEDGEGGYIIWVMYSAI